MEGSDAGEAAQWCGTAAHEAWQEGLRNVPTYSFVALMSFWALHIISRSPKIGLPPASRLQLQQYIATLMHGLLSVGAAGYLWYSGRAPATPHSSLYCYDRVASLFLCGHTGFLLYELIFYARYNKLVTPQFPMHMIHHVVFLLAIVMTQMAPLSAHITFLPWYELSNVSGLAYGLYGAALLLKWSRDKQAAAVRAGLGAALFKAVAGGVVAVRLLSHLQSDKPWKRAQSAGEEKVLKITGFVGMSTAVISALIFVLWFQQLLARSSQFLNAISRLSRGLPIDPPGKRAADKADKKAAKKAGKRTAPIAPSPRLNKKTSKA